MGLGRQAHKRPGLPAAALNALAIQAWRFSTAGLLLRELRFLSQ
jgi:hypothetical protein